MYLGLVLMCGFILYDTQAIIEKRRAGNKDFIGHSLDLFIDFIGVLRRLLVILTQKVNQFVHTYIFFLKLRLLIINDYYFAGRTRSPSQARLIVFILVFNI